MCVFVGVLLLAVAVMVWAVRGMDEGGDGFHLRVVCTIGAGLVTASFLSMPWVVFSPTDYVIHLGPEVIEDAGIEGVAFLLELVQKSEVSRVVSLFSGIGFIPGWLLIILLPSKILGVRLVILAVGLTGIFGLLWFPVSLFLRSDQPSRAASWLQLVLGLGLALLLLVQMPVIDSWGTKGTLWPALVAILAGVKMGPGIWVAWMGLIILAIGSLLQLARLDPAGDLWEEFDL